MAKRVSKKSKAASKQQASPKKQAPKKKALKKKAPKKAVKKKTAKKGTAKKQGTKKKTTKKAVKKKAAPKKTAAKKTAAKKTAAKKTTTKKSAPKTTAAKKATGYQSPLAGVSTVYAASKTNQWQPYPLLRIVEAKEARQEMKARKEELEDQYKKAQVAYGLLSEELEQQRKRRKDKKTKARSKKHKDFGDVTGIKICFRTKFGLLVSPLQYVIAVRVSEKKPEKQLKEHRTDPLPIEINGVPVKVMQGNIELAESESIPQAIIDSGSGNIISLEPDESIMGGQPIAEVGFPSNFGTLGIVFGKGKKNYGISNMHVVSREAIRLTTSDPQNIGKVRGAMSDQPDNVFIDAAYFLLELPEIPGTDSDGQSKITAIPYKIKGFDDHTPGLDVYFSEDPVKTSEQLFPVYKYGARTGTLLIGFLETVEEKVRVKNLVCKQVFTAAHEKRTFSVGGESGSLMLMKAIVRGKLAWLVIGILFARLSDSDRVAVGCHFSEVIKQLKLKNKFESDKIVPRTDWEIFDED